MFSKVDKYFFGELGSKSDRFVFFGTLVLALLLCTFSFVVTGGN